MLLCVTKVIYDDIRPHSKVFSSAKHFHGVFTASLDDLCHIYKFPQPNYIKIDVDGIEMKILKGGRNVLQNPVTKSVLIEFPKGNQEMLISGVELFEKLGFELIKYSTRGNDDNYIFNRKSF